MSTTGVDTSTSFTVKYGSGAAAGEVWTDYVGFAGYNVSGQGLALCDTVSSGLVNGNLSGLFGALALLRMSSFALSLIHP